MVNLQGWPFEEPRAAKIFTTMQVLEGIYPILCIVHEYGDGGWRFLDLQKTDPYDMAALTLEQMAERLPPDVLEVAIGMPLCSLANRASVGEPWIHESWEPEKPRQKKSKSPRR